MKTKRALKFAAALLLLSTINTQLSTAFAQGTAFTYQGRLNDGANPATGNYDLRFTIYDAVTSGNVVGGPLTNAPTAASNGLFTVTLDPGAGVFTGPARWLEIAARTNGSAGAYTVLAPRQPLTPTPYAIFANGASNLLGTLPAGQLSGTLSSGNLSGTYANPVTFNNAGNNFTGSGAGLTALNAANVSSGTLNDARLSGNVALRNANQTFTGANTFNNAGNTFTGSFTGNGAGLTNINLLTASPAYAITLTTNAGPFGFVSNSSPVVGISPYSVVAADANGDGKVDLISANSGTNTLTVLTNNGFGIFGSNATLTVGNGPRAVVATAVAFNGTVTNLDVNGDGKADLISANFYANTLTVLTNNGSGGFVLASTPLAGNLPFAVTAADVNGDGKVDLISANSTISGTLTVLTNNGFGTFGSNATLTVGREPHSVVAADVDEDGKVDLISANYNANTLTVLTNNGFGVFGSNATLTVGFGPYSVAAADVNGDGKVDLISANSFDNTLTVLTNNGSGHFVLASSPGVGNDPVSVAAADVNGDGMVDLISANASDNTLTVLLNGNGNAFLNGFTLGVGSGPSSVIAADVNGGSAMDLISANYNDNTLTVLLNTLTAVTTTPTFSGDFTGNGSGLTLLNATNITGTLDAAQIPNLDADKITSGTLGANRIPNLDASKITTGTLADARLSANVALLDRNPQTYTGTNIFTGNVGIGITNPAAKLDVQGDTMVRGLFTMRGTSIGPTNGATLNPASSYVQLTPASSVTLSATTAIANGTTAGNILVLENVNASFTVTIDNGANTKLSAASHVLGLGDTLTLVWDGLDWVELSFANN